MKLKCTECGYQVDSSLFAEGFECFDSTCEGTMEFYRPSLPMVGDPIESDPRSGHASHRNFDRQKVLYKHVMDQKHSIVPEHLRRGLWYHW